MLLFFNQEIIKDLDKKNEYLYIFNVRKEKKKYLSSYFKNEKRSRNPTSFHLYIS